LRKGLNVDVEALIALAYKNTDSGIYIYIYISIYIYI